MVFLSYPLSLLTLFQALVVLDYLILHASESVVLWSKDNIYVIKTLREFQYIDDDGRDQGSSIRARAKSLTDILQDDDRLRHERLARKNGRRRGSLRRSYREDEDDIRSRRGRSRAGSRPDDDEMQRALSESRRTAEEEERRRRAGGQDNDLNKAISLSKEEDEKRYVDSVFQPASQSQPNLTSNAPVQVAPIQLQFTAQPMYVQQQLPQQQLGVFGNGYQQPVDTGYIQSMYATGQQYTGFPQQNQFAFNQQVQQPVQQQFFTGVPQMQQQQPQQEPLQALKTGSNNPFASQKQPEFKLDQLRQQQLLEAQRQAQEQAQQQQQQLAQQQQQQQQLAQQQSSFSQEQQQQQRSRIRPSITGQSASHLEELNTMLATGGGLDTYGNEGDMRIPAQHTRSTFINSQGTGRVQSISANPFGQQYTGVVTTNTIQPAFTGFGFGNAQQSQQAYQQSFQPQQQYPGSSLV